jgi:hypothetical protein
MPRQRVLKLGATKRARKKTSSTTTTVPEIRVLSKRDIERTLHLKHNPGRSNYSVFWPAAFDELRESNTFAN